MIDLMPVPPAPSGRADLPLALSRILRRLRELVFGCLDQRLEVRICRKLLPFPPFLVQPIQLKGESNGRHLENGITRDGQDSRGVVEIHLFKPPARQEPFEVQ